jgi:hypothetical protein
MQGCGLQSGLSFEDAKYIFCRRQSPFGKMGCDKKHRANPCASNPTSAREDLECPRVQFYLQMALASGHEFKVEIYSGKRLSTVFSPQAFH